MQIILHEIEEIKGKKIWLTGVAKLNYQDGMPLFLVFDRARKEGIEISLLHLVNDFWDNGASWRGIKSKLADVIGLGSLSTGEVDFAELKYFYECLEQPKRANGGYEESRAMFFDYLYQNESNAKNWLISKIIQ